MKRDTDGVKMCNPFSCASCVSLEDSASHVIGRDTEMGGASKVGSRSFVHQRVGKVREVLRIGEVR